jgi:hypothetical protein
VHLYQGTTEQFIADAVQARLADQLSDRFSQEFRYKPAMSEVNSWRNSLGAMASVLQLADLRDQGVLVELKLAELRASERRREMFHGKNVVDEFYRRHLHATGLPKSVFTFEAARYARRRKAVKDFFDEFFAALDSASVDGLVKPAAVAAS